tara:strand:+ start:62 stop:280 length:219 start_codon:yes stop_codon:yes gene_type:complete
LYGLYFLVLISAYLKETSIQLNGFAEINKEFIGSEFTMCNFKFPSSRILDDGILIRPISPLIFEERPTSEYK